MPKLREMHINVHTQYGDQVLVMDEKKAKSIAEHYFIAPEVHERICWLLLVDMSINLDVNGISPFSVSDQIRHLESGWDKGNHMKKATQFMHPPLYPLWHQHYFSAHFLARNIYEEFQRKGNGEKIIREIFDPKKSETVTQEMINEMSHRTTVELFEKRANESRSTGEWLVYAVHDEKKYYLCMATHTSPDTNPDQSIYEKLKLVCRMQFPFLEPFASDRTLDSLCPLD